MDSGPVVIRSDVLHLGRHDGENEDVCMVVQDPRGQVVVARKPNYPPGVMRLPTGGIDAGESPVGAFLREVEEEFGLEPTHFRSLRRIGEVRFADVPFTTQIVLGPLREIAAPGLLADQEFSSAAFVPVDALDGFAAALELLPRSLEVGATTQESNARGPARAVLCRAVGQLLSAAVD